MENQRPAEREKMRHHRSKTLAKESRAGINALLIAKYLAGKDHQEKWEVSDEQNSRVTGLPRGLKTALLGGKLGKFQSH